MGLGWSADGPSYVYGVCLETIYYNFCSFSPQWSLYKAHSSPDVQLLHILFLLP